MGDVSKRLNRREFACHCNCGFAAVDCELVDVLEDVADHFCAHYQAGRCMIIVTSGCRCYKHNEVVQKAINTKYKPGTSKSQHVNGMAADFYLVIQRREQKFKVPLDKVAQYLDNKYPNQYGLGRGYASFTHVDVRKRKARW